MNDRPRIAVTMGDAAGIGPEIIVKALAGPAATERCIPIVLGDGGVLGRAMDLAGLRLPLRRIARPAEAEGRPGCLELIDHRRLDETAHRWGEVSAANGASSQSQTGKIFVPQTPESFTYDLDGTPMWLVVTAPKTAPGTYAGTLYRTTGPAFNAVPFNPASAVPTAVGTATLSFADGNMGTFAYTVNGVSQTKAVTREIFSGGGTICQ